MIVLALALLVGSLEAARTASAADYVGAERCGNCHRAEYQQWRSSGHATALARLSKVQQRDTTCRACHTMSSSSDDPSLAGVQCESCHGPGRLYSPRYVMKDPELSKLLNLLPVTEEQCAPCHAKDTPSVREFKFAEKIALVRHKAAADKKTKSP